MKKEITRLCTELRLGTIIAEKYNEIVANTNEEFLHKLLQIAVEERESSRKNRLLKQAEFDMLKTFEDYIFSEIEIPTSITEEEIKTGNFIEKKENLILYGGVGTGKTHLATAIGVNCCYSGKKVKFYRTAALVNDLIEAKKKGDLKRVIKRIESLDLLICDEWGYIPLDNEGAQLLFQVIAGCYEKISVIITTNIEFSRWNNIFYDEKLTSAIIDRLIHHSHLLIFSGKSYRLKNSLLKM